MNEVWFVIQNKGYAGVEALAYTLGGRQVVLKWNPSLNKYGMKSDSADDFNVLVRRAIHSEMFVPGIAFVPAKPVEPQKASEPVEKDEPTASTANSPKLRKKRNQ